MSLDLSETSIKIIAALPWLAPVLLVGNAYRSGLGNSKPFIVAGEETPRLSCNDRDGLLARSDVAMYRIRMLNGQLWTVVSSAI